MVLISTLIVNKVATSKLSKHSQRAKFLNVLLCNVKNYYAGATTADYIRGTPRGIVKQVSKFALEATNEYIML